MAVAPLGVTFPVVLATAVASKAPLQTAAVRQPSHPPGPTQPPRPDSCLHRVCHEPPSSGSHVRLQRKMLWSSADTAQGTAGGGKDALPPGRAPEVGDGFSHDLICKLKKKRLVMEVPQMQDGPEECPPGTGCSQINSQNVCICSLCRGSDADEPELQDQKVKSDILGMAKARGAERTSGARGTGGCKGSVVLGKGVFWGPPGTCH